MPASTTSAPVLDVGIAVLLGACVALHASTSAPLRPATVRGRLRQRMLPAVIAPLCAVAGALTGLLDVHTVVPATGAVYAAQHLATSWSTRQTAHSPRRFGKVTPTLAVDVSRPHRPALAPMHVLLAFGTVGFFAVVCLLPGEPESMSDWFMAPILGAGSGLACAVPQLSNHGRRGRPAVLAWVAAAYAVPMAASSGNWITLCLASGGLALASVATGERLLFGEGAPPADYRSSLARKRTARGALHAATWAAFASAAILTAPRHGTRALASDTIFSVAMLLAALVFFSSITDALGTDPISSRPPADAPETTTVGGQHC